MFPTVENRIKTYSTGNAQVHALDGAIFFLKQVKSVSSSASRVSQAKRLSSLSSLQLLRDRWR